MMLKAPLIFIYQFGFKQISLPPKQEGMNNFDVIDIKRCEDGCYIKTANTKEDYLKLKEFIGRKVTQVWCDTNDISTNEVFTKCELTTDDYGSDVILVWTS